MSNKRLVGWLITIWLLGVSGCQSTPRIPEVMATVALLPQAGNPGAIATNTHTGYTYVLNGFQYIAVFQGIQMLDLLPIGNQGMPYYLATDETQDWLYAINTREDSVAVIRGTEVITNVAVAGRNVKGVAVTSHGWTYIISGYRKDAPYYTNNTIEGNATVISGTQVIGTVSLGRTIPTQVVAEPMHNAVYVGGMDEEVVVIEDLQITTRIPITASVKVMDVNPQTGDIYILDVHGYLYQVQQRQIVATLWVAKEYSVPQNMQVHPTTGDVYLVNTGGEVLVARDMQIVAQIPLESGTLKMDIDPLTGNVYVANYRKDNVSVIYDTKVITTIQVGWYPYGIGVNPANGWVYVSNTNDSTVTILGYPDN